MILEQVVLDVAADRAPEYEEVFAEATSIIAGSPGFRSLQLHRCVERAGRYLLLVEWETLADHTEGFRGSPAYQRWRSMLHHFYDPVPDVEHYEQVLEV